MSQIGKVVDLPTVHSQYARVRDEYGGEYTVHSTELPDDAEIGSAYSYKVDVWQNPSGNSTTLRRT